MVPPGAMHNAFHIIQHLLSGTVCMVDELVSYHSQPPFLSRFHSSVVVPGDVLVYLALQQSNQQWTWRRDARYFLNMCCAEMSCHRHVLNCHIELHNAKPTAATSVDRLEML